MVSCARLGLDITPTENPDWTEEEKEKLVQHERQGGLFKESDAKSIATLRKLPFDFHYRYACKIGDETREYRHKIVDWEAGALSTGGAARVVVLFQPPDIRRSATG